MSYDADKSVNPFAAPQKLLCERLDFLLSTIEPLLQTDVKRAFEESGKLLFRPSDDVGTANPHTPAGTWPLLTLLIARHISPNIGPALAGSVAIATECFVCALDLLDDVEDEDQTPIIQELGVARVLNISTVLLALAQQSILSIVQYGGTGVLVLRLLRAWQETILTATIGQHRDLLAERQKISDFTREECIEIATAKAGAIMRVACVSGAICAGASEVELREFAEIGELLGIAHQLDNDAHDLYYLLRSVDTAPGFSSGWQGKTDLARRKKTLPVVLAADVIEALQESHEPSDELKQEHLQALHEGIITTWGISLLYRERANDRLRAIALRKSLAPELRLLLGFE